MPQPRDPKPPEVVHFDTVKEVMDALRGQHPALTASLEAFLTDIGATPAPLQTFVQPGFYAGIAEHWKQTPLVYMTMGSLLLF